MGALNWIKEELDRNHAHYHETHRERVAFTAQQLAEIEHVSGHRVAKVVFAFADGKPLELILPASRKVDMDRMRDFLGTRNVRLADEKEMAKFCDGCEVGSVPPLRHWTEIAVVMDDSMKVGGDILFQGGTHRDAIRMPFQEWFSMVKPEVGSFTEQPASVSSRRTA